MAATLLASAAVKEVISKLASLGWKEVELLWDFKEDLEDMDRTLSILQSVLLDAQKRSLEDGAIRLWLDHLKDAAYDIEDLMNDFLVKSQHWRRDEFFRKLRRFLSLSNPLILRGTMAHKLKKMSKKLKKIAEYRKDYLLKEETDLEKQEIITNRATFSEVNESVVYGREQDKEMIIEMLLDENSEEDVSVIPIVGIGGLGKTTLAQFVYNDQRIKDQSNSNLRAWVYVSMEFDLLKLAGDLLSAIGCKHDIRTLQDARIHVGEALADKKYLIVLDDFWTENERDCNDLKLMLRGGARGSKIIVTTRSEKVAELIGTVQPYLLQPLSEHDCWMLFKSKAFRSADEENKYQRLMEIGMEVAKKCGGVPLAANALGSMMRFKRRENSWIAIRDSEMLELHKDENWSEDTILDSLKLSCLDMPPQLKLCFSYCSIFPKGQEIDKDKLIQQWIALGFIKTTQQHRHLTRSVDIGEECIDNLRGMSFLQDFENYSGRVTYKMHDLVHDLAKFVGGSEFMTVNNYSMGANDNVKSYRYTTLVGDMDPSMIYEVVSKKVRLLHLRMSFLKEIPKQLFSLIENVRVLDLSGSKSIKKIPTSINKLEQLRYLDASCRGLHALPEFTSDHLNLQILHLSESSIKKIPKTIGKLQHLQYLDLSCCYRLGSLPESIGKLQSLQHLDLSWCDKLGSLPESIGKLQSLKHLDLSCCYDLGSLPESIGKLQSLQQLILSHCSNLGSLPVDIGKLAKLQHLNLSFCGALKKLPQSIDDLLSLKHLDLSDCSELEELPVDIGKLVKLQHLNLSYCRALKKLPQSIGDLLNLQHLDLSYCSRIEELPVDIGKLVKLQHLNLSFCLALKKLPQFICNLVNLEKLNLRGCGKLRDLPGGLLTLNSVMLVYFDGNEIPMRDVRRRKLEDTYIVEDACSKSTSTVEGQQHFCASCVNLELHDLRELRDPSDALIASLRQNAKLESLTLSWSSARFDWGWRWDRVLEQLLPPPNLLVLKLRSYLGYRFPNWMMDGIHLRLPNLIEMELCEITKCDRLPPLGLLPHLKKLGLHDVDGIRSIGLDFFGGNQMEVPFPSLEELHIGSMDNCAQLPPLSHLPRLKILKLFSMNLIKNMGEEFFGGKQMKSLEELYLSRMLNLEDWLTIMSWNDDTAIVFPCLKNLVIVDCPCLRPRPCIPLSVVRLYLKGGDEVLSSWDPVSCSLSSSSSSIARQDPEFLFRLEELNIIQCNNITRLPEGMRHLQSLRTLLIQDCYYLSALSEWLGELASLTNLEIRGCRNLASLPEGMRHLQSLRTLRIQDCDYLPTLLKWLGELASLTNLEIRACHNLKSLPEVMRHLQSLRTLRIQHCYKLAELPEWLGELASLTNLEIRACHNLESLPEGMRRLQSLRTLRIQHCYMLAELPKWLGEHASLTNLEIRECYNLQSLSESIRHIQSLRTLRIQDCVELAELPEWLGELASLTNLGIGCCNLQSLPEGMRHLQSLGTLRIQHCEKLAELPEWLGELASLTNLEIRSCHNLESLPEGMRHLQSLRTLRIQHCYRLAELPEWLGELASLTNLEIRGCSKIVSLPQSLQCLITSGKITLNGDENDLDESDEWTNTYFS